jgi:LysM repeat protein
VKRPVNAGRRHRLVLVPTELDRVAFECALAYKNLRANIGKASDPRVVDLAKMRLQPRACQIKPLMPTFEKMKVFTVAAAAFLCGLLSFTAAWAQAPSPESSKSPESAQLELLAKRIDEQNTKIDALSQEILKLEQQISHIRPGVMIGEGTPSTSATGAPAESPRPQNGSTHVVARGETLTSIAKMYKVSVDELQKANHIEDGRKLQAGQTIVIPEASSPSPSVSPPPTE